MQNLQNLQNIQNISSWWSSLASKLALLFDWVNDYWYQSHNRNWCIEKLNDWTRNYLNCTWFWGYVSCTDTNQEFWLNSRSVQTLKFVWTIENLLNQIAMFSYWWYTTASVLTSWQIQVELQWTWSIRINSTTTLLPNTIYNIIIRVNNSLSSWTARVIGDADIFINWVKETKWTSAVWTDTSTWSFLNWWAYNSTTNRWIWKMYSLTVRNRALSDWECASEWASNFSIVNTDYLRTFNADNTSRSVWATNKRLSHVIWWNVSLWSDANWQYMYFNWSQDGNAWVWSWASVYQSAYTSYLNNNTSFTMKIKFIAETAVTNQNWWLFASNFDVWIHMTTTQIYFWARNWSTVQWYWFNYVLWTLYELFLDYDANDQKVYAYNWTTLLNPWWTAIPWSFTLNDLYVWDNWILWSNPFSNKKKIYHARIYWKILSTAEKTADLALWNTIPSNPLILNEIRPEWFADYNLLTNTDNLWHADRSIWANTTRTLNYWTAPNWTNTSCRIQFSATWWITWNRFDQTKTTTQLWLAWWELASKQMTERIFVRSATANQKFRLKITHSWVQDWLSADFTATTERKEYSHVPTLWASTSWTWLVVWIVQASDASACDIEIWSPWLWYWLKNMFDYACSIWHIWRFTNVAVCGEFQSFIDWANSATSQALFLIPWRYLHIRDSTNSIQWRRETKRNSNPATFTLWSWYRKKTKYAVFATYDWNNFVHELWIDWELKWSHTSPFVATSFYANLTIWQYWWTYYNWKQRWLRGYTFTWSLTSDEKKALSWEHIQLPNLTNIFNFLPKKSEQNSKVLEPQMWTDKKITLVNWVTKWSR